MAALTIAQRREKQLHNFNNEFIHDLAQAKKIVNSYYRLCALSYRVCLLQNSEKFCNSDYCKEQEAKEAAHIKRLNGYLSEYGVQLAYCGIYPTIAIVEKNTHCIKRDVFYCISY